MNRLRKETIEYVARYGGNCRDCADNHGICPSSMLPCDPDIRRAAIGYMIDAIKYGTENGFLNAAPPSSTQGGR